MTSCVPQRLLEAFPHTQQQVALLRQRPNSLRRHLDEPLRTAPSPRIRFTHPARQIPLPLQPVERDVQRATLNLPAGLILDLPNKLGPVRTAQPQRRREHHARPVENRFTKSQRPHTTVLHGGLTLKHEKLIDGCLRGLGYKPESLPCPDVAAFQTGKEYGNNGQCNPTYFTVGALVNHLKNMRDDKHMSLEEIINNNVFITAGACGPCRFGMYEAEYRLALRNSGFDGFRVLLFQQQGGLNQDTVEAGLDFNLNFFLSLVNAIFMGDILNEVAYQIRPYEVVPGQTNRVFEKCVALGETAEWRPAE